MAQYTQRTQSMHRHSKWLNKTFGDIGVFNPECQTVCEIHADPEFLRIIKARSDYKDSKSKSDDPSPGPSVKSEPDSKKKPSAKTVELEPGSKKKTNARKRGASGKVKRGIKKPKRNTKKLTKDGPDTPQQVQEEFEFVSIPENYVVTKDDEPEHLESKQETLKVVPRAKRPKRLNKVSQKRAKVDSNPAITNDKSEMLEVPRTKISKRKSLVSKKPTKTVTTTPVKASESDVVKSEIIIKEDPDANEADMPPSLIPEFIQIKEETSEENMDTDVHNQSLVNSVPTASQDKSGFNTITHLEIKYEDHTNFMEDIYRENLGIEIKTEQNEVSEDKLDEYSETEPNLQYQVIEPVISGVTAKTEPLKDFITVDELLQDLVERKYISTTEMEVLAAHKLECRLLKEEVPCTSTLHSKLQAFAVNLYVYSPKAYEYIRENYNTILPDTTTMRDWLVKPRGHSGFSSETMLVLSAKAVRSKSPLLVCLDIKEMKLARSRAYEGPKQRANINPLDWSVICAKSVLIFTAVAIKANWKLPIGYFWTNVVKDKANLVKAAISIIEKVGAEPVAVSFDYNEGNLEMCKQLSSYIVYYNKHLTSVFLSESGKEILLFPDPRGILEDMYKDAENINSIVDDNHNPVLLDQNILQAKFYGTQTTPQQLLRKTVASELFKNDCSDFTASTVRFFKNLHVVLDVLSCRMDCRNFKKNILNRVVTNSSTEPLKEAEKYFKGLQIQDSTMQNCILGLCALIDSALMFIFKYSNLRFKFGRFVGSTYFLANLTPLGENKRSPTALYFQKEYKTTLQQIALGSQRKSKANVKSIPLLKCRSPIERINITTYLSNGNTILYVVDDLGILFGSKHTEYHDMIELYIARFVTYSLVRRLRCEICIRALRSERVTKQQAVSRFAVKLDNPTPDVLKICKKAEAAFKNVCHSQRKPKSKFNVPVLLIKMMKEFVDRPLFEDIAHHQFDTDGTCNHIVELAKAVAELYLKIRIQYHSQTDPNCI